MPKFVVQEHHATRLHWDFRLEMAGKLKSWAVPKGPSLDPSQRRLAIQVQDHSLRHARYEGIIPKGSYGAGPVLLWDRGTYQMVAGRSAVNSYRKGEIEFILKGKQLQGTFALIKLKGKKTKKNWLLIKKNDRFAKKGWETPVKLTRAREKKLKIKKPSCGNAS